MISRLAIQARRHVVRITPEERLKILEANAMLANARFNRGVRVAWSPFKKVVNWLIPPKKYTQSAIEMQMNPYREVVQSVAQVKRGMMMIYMCALLPSIVVCTPYLLPEEYNVMAGVLAKPMRDRDDVEREIQQAWF